MTESPPPVHQTPPPPDVPPTQPPRRPRWHIPRGVVCMALAVLGALSAVASIAGWRLNPQQQEAMGQFPEWYTAHLRFAGVVGAGLAVVLLLGGLLLLKRRPEGRALLLAYAVLSAITNLVEAAVMFKAVGEMTGGGMEAQIMRTSMKVGAVMGAAIGLAFPIFLVVWFSRLKIRTDIQGGAAARGPG